MTKYYEYAGLEFEWDSQKAALNVEKHGVSFFEAATVFLDDEGLIIPDLKHSGEEDKVISDRVERTSCASQLRMLLVVSGTGSSLHDGLGLGKGARMKDQEIDDEVVLTEEDFPRAQPSPYPEIARRRGYRVLAEDVRNVFPDSASVNDALRVLIKAGKEARERLELPKAS